MKYILLCFVLFVQLSIFGQTKSFEVDSGPVFYIAVNNGINFSKQYNKQYPDKVISRVVKVVDGDTIKVDIDDWPDIIGKNIAVRIYGIDTPEKHSKIDEERAIALKAMFFAKKMVKSAKIITLHNIGRDKYFRINADVLVDGKSLGAELIKNKLALPYFGDTKHDFTQMIEERKRSFIDEK